MYSIVASCFDEVAASLSLFRVNVTFNKVTCPVTYSRPFVPSGYFCAAL